MSVFDLFRGFFGVPGGHNGGRRDPFFDAMTHEDDDDDEDDGHDYDGFRRDRQDPFDGAWRFGFSFGPDGMRIQEPPVFGHVLREMEEMFSQLGRWDTPESGNLDVPRIMPPPHQDGAERGGGGSGVNTLRDFMLKSPDGDRRGPYKAPPEFPSSSFPGRTPFSKFRGIWRQGPQEEDGHKEDRDLDSAVSTGGLDQILSPPAGQAPNQPRPRSFFQSVTVTKVVKSDGTVEERRTVRDGQGNEETTVTRSGSDHQAGPVLPGGQNPFPHMRDDDSFFSKFF